MKNHKYRKVETHGRAGTEAQLEGLPVSPRKKIFYKGKELEEMDLETILQLHPELVVVYELAHTNVEGCRNKKRWQDVMELLDAGINVVCFLVFRSNLYNPVCVELIHTKSPSNKMEDAL